MSRPWHTASSGSGSLGKAKKAGGGGRGTWGTVKEQAEEEEAAVAAESEEEKEQEVPDVAMDAEVPQPQQVWALKHCRIRALSTSEVCWVREAEERGALPTARGFKWAYVCSAANAVEHTMKLTEASRTARHPSERAVLVTHVVPIDDGIRSFQV